MNALSRREEDTLLKTTKARALKECDPVVKGTYSCHQLLLDRLNRIRIRGMRHWSYCFDGLGM